MRAQRTIVDLDAAREHAVEIAEQAGALIRRLAGGDDLGIREKDGRGDLVTSVDLAAEEMIIHWLVERYPEHRIVAEESGINGGPEAEWTWLVDPLDGTNNLAIGLRTYVVGIALCDSGLPVVGVVHDPVSRDTWSAVRGRGVRGPIRSRRVNARAWVLAWTQGHTVSADPRWSRTAAALRNTVEPRAHRMLQLWAPLLSWVLLARGDIDGFVGYRAEGVDLPAGLLIAAEAGIVVRDLNGQPFDGHLDRTDEQRTFVAGRIEIIDELVAIVRSAPMVESGR